MAGRGPVPKPPDQRRTQHVPTRGEWQAAPGVGWQHGGLPDPPAKLLKASREAWDTWFRAWYAAHWRPEDLPQLRQLIRLFDSVERDPLKSSLQTALRLGMNAWGLTPEGQQARRWAPPKSWVEPEEPETPEPEAEAEAPPPPSRYGHLRPVAEG